MQLRFQSTVYLEMTKLVYNTQGKSNKRNYNYKTTPKNRRRSEEDPLLNSRSTSVQSIVPYYLLHQIVIHPE